MVRYSIFTHKSGAVDAESHGEVLDSHVVNDFVVGTLHECGVYAAERHQPVFRHAARKRHGVSLGNTHIECTLRYLIEHEAHGAACGHCSSDSHYLLVAVCKFHEGVSEHVLELRWLAGGVAHNAFSGRLIEFARGVPCGGVVFGRLVAFSLAGAQMQNLRTVHVLDVAEHAHYFSHIVAVERTEVANIQPLKYILLARKQSLEAVVEPKYGTFVALIHQIV